MAPRRHIWRPTTSTHLTGDTLVIVLSGRLGEAGARGEPLLAALAGAGAHDAVVVDLAGLDYVSSPGVAHLATFNRAQADRAIACAWAAMSEAVRVSLDLAGVLPEFTLAPSRDEALASLGAPATVAASS